MVNHWVPVSSCGSSCIPQDPERVGVLRFTGRVVALVTVAVVGLATAPVMLVASRRVRAPYCRLLSRWMLVAAGLRLEVIDHRPPHARRVRGALLVANHISCLDIPALAALTPARFVAKSEVLAMGGRFARATGLALGSLGVIGHGRGDLRNLPGDVARVSRILDGGRPVVVFPEGTTWCGVGAGRFRPAFFQAAIDAGVPVLPVSIAYRRSGRTVTAPGYIGEDGLADTLSRVLWARSLRVSVVVQPLQLPFGDRRELADHCERLVRSKPAASRSQARNRIIPSPSPFDEGARSWSPPATISPIRRRPVLRPRSAQRSA